MVFALVVIAIAIGSVLFHLFSPWQATPIASNWGMIDDTIAITMGITGFVFVLLVFFMGYCVIRYRHKEGRQAAFEPEDKKMEWWLIAITTLGICALLAPGLIVYNKFVHVPDDATEFEAVGQQWMWTFRLAGKDGVMGAADVSHMNIDNPYGIDPDDPNGQDDLLISKNHIHLLLDQPVKALLRSKDVLHNFYVPQFRVKMDLVPGLVSYLWFTPNKVGSYEILCSEYCGINHYNMRGRVTVDTADDYQTWLASLPTFAQTLSQASTGGLKEQGKKLAQSQGCLACHSVDGGKSLGPGWKNLYGKTETLIDGSSAVADDEYLKQSITNPKAAIVDGYPDVMVAYKLSTEQLDALVAYIQSLSGDDALELPNQDDTSSSTAENETAAATLTGTPAQQGKALAEGNGCLACHSVDGSKSLGPGWKDLFGKTETLVDGSTVVADENYLKQSILIPKAALVDGYPDVMVPYPLSDEQLDALVAYIKSLSEDSEED